LVDTIIIADAGPLIAFGKIKNINLLAKIFGNIIATDFVLQECLANTAQDGAQEIREALNNHLITPFKSPTVTDHEDLFSILGQGEASAIILASQWKASLLIDEKLGRKIAKKMDIPIIGTAGVLLLAKEKKLIEKIEPIIRELKNKGYYLSKELVQSVLTIAKEKFY
jgi:predicted nucleic acid-binding protein